MCYRKIQVIRIINVGVHCSFKQMMTFEQRLEGGREVIPYGSLGEQCIRQRAQLVQRP